MAQAPRRALLALTCMALAGAGSTCTTCRPTVDAAIYNRDFPKNAAATLLPVALLAAIGLSFAWTDRRPR